MKNALKQLKMIEKKHSLKSGIEFEIDVWEDIAMEINSHIGEEQYFWCSVMDLYHEKNKQKY